MVPVDESIDRPEGSCGEIVHSVTVPPLDVGVAGVIGASLEVEIELGV